MSTMTLAERRETLVNSLRASKSWTTGYAEAFVDDYVISTQPAQAVDVGAIRDVIEQMRKASAQRAMPPHYEAGCYMAWIDDLTRALSGEKAGPVDLEHALNFAAANLPAGAEIIICIEKDAGTVSAADWDGNWREFDSVDMSFAEQVRDCVEWCKSSQLPASPAPDKEG